MACPPRRWAVREDALQQIADATGGAAYAALDPEDLQGVLFDAIRRRG